MSALIPIGIFLSITGLIVAGVWHWLPGTIVLISGIGLIMLEFTFGIASWAQENIVEINKGDETLGTHEEDRSARDV